MRSADGDENAGLTDFHAAQAVNDRDAVNGKLLMNLCADFPHFRERHGFIGFVLEVQSGAPMRFIAHETVKGDDGSILPGTDPSDDSGGIDGSVD